MSIKSSSGKWGLIVLVWVLLAVPVVVLVWYFQFRSSEKLTDTTSSESRYKYTVRMAADWFSGYCVFRSEEFSRALRDQQIKFEYEDDGADYKARLLALEKGKADIVPFPVNSLIEMCGTLDISPATIILFIDETKGADAIVAYKTAVKNLDDLNHSDVRFVLTPGSPSEYLARVVKADLDLSNLSNNWIQSADGAQAVYNEFKKASRSQPMAYVLWEPFVSKALQD
ncbi:MAG: type 2 periplasmic-binding domain-containing protein, partial [Planctomycetota bacterium]